MNCENCMRECNDKNTELSKKPPKITGGFLNLTQRCNLSCKYCMPKGTKILMPDLSYKNIEDIKIGDKIIGFDEFRTKGKHRKLYITTVKQIHCHIDNIIRITLEDGSYIIITENHPILNNRVNYNNGWKKAGDYKAGQSIKCFSGIEYSKPNTEDINYKIGYFISVMLGDGSFKNYDYSDRFFIINKSKRKGQTKNFRIRLAVKDNEIIDRIEEYSKCFNISWNKRKFLISNYKENIYKDALFSTKESIFNNINNLIKNNLLKNNTYEYYCGFLAGIYDTEGHIDKKGLTIRICNSNKKILKTIIDGLNILNIDFVIEKNKNKINEQAYNVRINNGFHKYDNLKFVLSVNNAVERKGIENFYNKLELYSKKIIDIKPVAKDVVYNIGTTSRTYVANNIAVHNCFVEQQPKDIDLQTAKDAADFFAKNAKEGNTRPSINYFGGEPLLRWDDIVVPLTKHIREKYGSNYQIGITSNCTLMTKEKLDFMKKNNIGLLFSIDGDKKTQDLNRPLKGGGSSFDILKDKISMILSYYPNMVFRSTTDHDNVFEFLHNHKFAVEQGFRNVFNIVNVFSQWDKEEKEELKHQVDLMGNYFYELYVQNKKVRFNPFSEMFPKLKRIYNASIRNMYRSHADKNLGYGRCGIGASRFASVGVDGKLYSCQEMADNSRNKMFIIGDIYNGADDNARMNIINQFDIREVKCQNDTYKCSECKLNCICDGGCLANNYFVSGNLNIMPEMLCFYYKILLDKAEEINLKIAGR